MLSALRRPTDGVRLARLIRDRRRRLALSRLAAIAGTVAVAALLSEAEDWRPWELVAALAVVMVIADVIVIPTRRVRVSAGLMVQSTAMALLGPAPALAMGVTATAVESRVNRVTLIIALSNILIVAVLGLIGGGLFDLLGDQLGIDRAHSRYALLVLPVYAVLMAVNIALLMVVHPGLSRADRGRPLLESALPALPIEFINALIATGAVLVAASATLAAPAGLLVVLLITIPLARMLGDALASDERAAEVASLASDRDRLVVEVVNAEERERARLADSLHDGPMQRLMAMRQDVAAGNGTSHEELAAHLDRTIAETRAIISAFHPASVRELGFEASLRAAVEPFPAAAAVALTVDTAVDDRALAQSLAMSVARELVVVRPLDRAIWPQISGRPGHSSSGVQCVLPDRRKWRSTAVCAPSRAPKRPRAKRPRPLVGRMFYYVQHVPSLSCSPSRKQSTPEAVAAANGGKAGHNGLA